MLLLESARVWLKERARGLLCSEHEIFKDAFKTSDQEKRKRALPLFFLLKGAQICAPSFLGSLLNGRKITTTVHDWCLCESDKTKSVPFLQFHSL